MQTHQSSRWPSKPLFLSPHHQHYFHFGMLVLTMDSWNIGGWLWSCGWSFWSDTRIAGEDPWKKINHCTWLPSEKTLSNNKGLKLLWQNSSLNKVAFVLSLCGLVISFPSATQKMASSHSLFFVIRLHIALTQPPKCLYWLMSNIKIMEMKLREREKRKEKGFGRLKWGLLGNG